MSPGADWMTDDPIEIAGRAIEGGRKMILLELSRVGTGRGVGTEDLLAGILAARPGVEIIVGGGVTGVPEVLNAAGIRRGGYPGGHRDP